MPEQTAPVQQPAALWKRAAHQLRQRIRLRDRRISALRSQLEEARHRIQVLADKLNRASIERRDEWIRAENAEAQLQTAREALEELLQLRGERWDDLITDASEIVLEECFTSADDDSRCERAAARVVNMVLRALASLSGPSLPEVERTPGEGEG